MRQQNTLQAYLRDYGCEAAAEVYVLTHLAAIGGQKPLPKSSLLTCWLVAMALISWELLEIPMVRRCRTHQRNEDGFSGHIELAWKTRDRDAKHIQAMFPLQLDQISIKKKKFYFIFAFYHYKMLCIAHIYQISGTKEPQLQLFLIIWKKFPS